MKEGNKKFIPHRWNHYRLLAFPRKKRYNTTVNVQKNFTNIVYNIIGDMIKEIYYESGKSRSL